MNAERGTLRDLLKDDRIHVMDGAMGTVIYDRGVFVNVCYDALSVEQPELVGQIHRDYVEAGAEILETNTFGANPVKLSAYGMEDRTVEINTAAARLALEAAGDRAFVLGAVGPLGVRLEPWGPTAVSEAAGFFTTQMQALLDAGVHGLILETFSDVHELETAIHTARGLTDLPVFAHLTVGEGGATVFGTDAAEGARSAFGMQAPTLWGSTAPWGRRPCWTPWRRWRTRSTFPWPASPTPACRARWVTARSTWRRPSTWRAMPCACTRPEFAFWEGCCGTTPEHTRLLADTVRGLQPRHDSLRVPFVATREAPLDPAPVAERSKWGAAIAAGWATSVEIVPPAGWDASEMLEAAQEARARPGFTQSGSWIARVGGPGWRHFLPRP